MGPAALLPALFIQVQFGGSRRHNSHTPLNDHLEVRPELVEWSDGLAANVNRHVALEGHSMRIRNVCDKINLTKILFVNIRALADEDHA